MAMRIELWIEKRLVGGAEHWWDPIEAQLMYGQTIGEFPLLERIDPYDNAIFTAQELSEFVRELRAFALVAPDEASAIALEVAELARRGAGSPDSELRFKGD